MSLCLGDSSDSCKGLSFPPQEAKVTGRERVPGSLKTRSAAAPGLSGACFPQDCRRQSPKGQEQWPVPLCSCSLQGSPSFPLNLHPKHNNNEKTLEGPVSCLVLAFLTLGTSCSRLAGLHCGRESVGNVSRPGGRQLTGAWSLTWFPTPFFTATPRPPCPRCPCRLNKPIT